MSERNLVVVSDQQYQILVEGYVRQLSKSINIIIPTDIIPIIYSFYPRLDNFNEKLSEGFKFDVKEHTMKRLPTEVRSWRNGYGIHEIIPKEFINYCKNKNSNSEYDIIKVWRIKFIKLKESKFIMVGVIANSKIELVNDYFCCAGYGYGIYGSTSQTFHHYHSHRDSEWKTLNIKFDIKQIMEVILLFKGKDYTHCSLGYRSNGDIEIAFEKLDINEAYHVAIGMWSNHDCIQLV
eukprot:327866_1